MTILVPCVEIIELHRVAQHATFAEVKSIP